MALTVANYLVQPFFPECDAPPAAVSLIAASCICGLTFLNCYSMKVTTKLQNIFMFTKIAAVFLIIVIGTISLFQGKLAWLSTMHPPLCPKQFRVTNIINLTLKLQLES
jgi:amino acid transporter